MASEELSKEMVQHIARLARLELSEAEIAIYQERLGRVLGYMRELSEVQAPAGSAVSHIPRDAVAMRSDRVLEFPQPHRLLENAPDHTEDSFLLPAVLDGE